jgi:hypothetical protein
MLGPVPAELSGVLPDARLPGSPAGRRGGGG